MKSLCIASLVSVVVGGVIGFLHVPGACAHCDTMDGPVVQAAQQALETGNVSYLLPWVAEKDEAEITAAFERTRKVRALGVEAREMADMYFFETLVRIHRASEGAPYTGLKPAGLPENPAVAAADEAFASGSAEGLIALLVGAVKEGAERQFAETLAAQSANVNDLEARRRGVHAYVEFVHYVEAIHNAATMGASPSPAPHGSAEAQGAAPTYAEHEGH